MATGNITRLEGVWPETHERAVRDSAGVNLETKLGNINSNISQLDQEINGIAEDSKTVTLAVTAGTGVTYNNSLKECRLYKGRTYRIVLSGTINTIAMYFRNAENSASINVNYQSGSTSGTANNISFTSSYKEYTIVPSEDVFYVRFYAGASSITNTGNMVWDFNSPGTSGLADDVEGLEEDVADLQGMVQNEGTAATVSESQSVASGSQFNKSVEIPAQAGQVIKFKVTQTGGDSPYYNIGYGSRSLGRFSYGDTYEFLMNGDMGTLVFTGSASEGSAADFAITIDIEPIYNVEDIDKKMYFTDRSVTITQGKYINATKDTLPAPADLAGAGCAVGKVKPGEILKISGTGTSTQVGLYTFYNVDKTRIYTSTIASASKDEPIRVVVPEGAAFFSYNTYPYSATDSYIIVERVDTLGKVFDEMADLSAAVGQCSQLMWAGKNIVCFGDSITEFSDANDMTYAQYLAQFTGGNIVNVGIGGTRIACRTTPVASPANANQGYAALDCASLVDAVASQDFAIVDAGAAWVRDNESDDNTAIVARLKAIDWTKVDAVTFMLGVNDWQGGQAIGTSGENSITTTLGAINHIIATLLAAYPKVKIYWFTPVVNWASPRTDESWGGNRQIGSRTLLQFVDAVLAEVQNNCIPVCDMYRTLGWNMSNFSQYFNDNDGTHPLKGFPEIGRKFAAFINANRTF